ncbi:hypothetical protein [Compostimonas suwonensis]|uniref:Uncharacterized protein n=1 Tax=Compostimonas suwonensis TaxID=1048394 RepID=A0A2M9BCE6_9MICO|nr:hypothetical protein [Compostimonas suwonensis]PJJ55617.1 hypothetical protein CLV54_2964 [Compostimonas suwonensis]
MTLPPAQRIPLPASRVQLAADGGAEDPARGLLPYSTTALGSHALAPLAVSPGVTITTLVHTKDCDRDWLVTVGFTADDTVFELVFDRGAPPIAGRTWRQFATAMMVNTNRRTEFRENGTELIVSGDTPRPWSGPYTLTIEYSAS